MTQSEIDTIRYAGRLVQIYGLSFLVISGLIGNSVNILMFTTKLKGSPCSLYLLSGEIANSLWLIIYLVPIILQARYHRNGTESNLVWCKLFNYFPAVLSALSILMLCATSVDRYFSSSRSVRCRQRSSIKIAKIVIVIVTTLSLLFPLPDLVYVVIREGRMCTTVSFGYKAYQSYFVHPFLLGIFPVTILAIFGYMTWKNLKALHHQTEQVLNQTITVRCHHQPQRLNYQLARLLIIQILSFIVLTIPQLSINIYALLTSNYNKDSRRKMIEFLVATVALVIYNAYPAGSFYVYYLSSPTYRTSVKKLFFKVFQRQTDQPIQ